MSWNPGSFVGLWKTPTSNSGDAIEYSYTDSVPVAYVEGGTTGCGGEAPFFLYTYKADVGNQTLTFPALSSWTRDDAPFSDLDPQPDWIVVHCDVSIDLAFNYGVSCEDYDIASAGTATLAVDAAVATELEDPLSGRTTPWTDTRPGGGAPWDDGGTQGHVSGYVKRTDGNGYTGDPTNDAQEYLLRPSEVDHFLVNFAGNAGSVAAFPAMYLRAFWTPPIEPVGIASAEQLGTLVLTRGSSGALALAEPLSGVRLL